MLRNISTALAIAASGIVLACGRAEPPAPPVPAPEAPCAAVISGPPAVRACAIPSDTGHYIGYYVGGGKACLGDYPEPCDGTWGWDYRGLLLPHRVFLLWSHGRSYQGGTGAYRTDGPELLKHEGKLFHRDGEHD